MIYFTYNKNQSHQLFPNTRELFSKILDTKNLSVRITNVFKIVVLFIFEFIELLRNKLSCNDIRPKNSIVSRLNLFVKSNKSTIIKTAIITTTIAVAYCLKKRFSSNLEVTLPNSSKSELLKDICLKQDFVKAPFESSINSLQIEFDAIKSWVNSATANYKGIDTKFLDFASKAVKDPNNVTDNVKSLFAEVRSLYSNDFDSDLAEHVYQTISRAKNIDSNLLRALSNIRDLSKFNYLFKDNLKKSVAEMLDSVIDWQFYQMDIFSKIEKLKNAGLIDSYDLEMLLTKFVCNLLDKASSLNSTLIKNISIIKNLLPDEKNWSRCYLATNISNKKLDTKLLDFASRVVKDTSKVTNSVKSLFAEIRSLYSNDFDSDFAEFTYQTISNAKNIDSNFLRVLSNIRDLSKFNYLFKDSLKKSVDEMLDKVIANKLIKNDVFSRIEKLKKAGFIYSYYWEELLTKLARKLLDKASSVNSTLIENISEIKKLLPSLTYSFTYNKGLTDLAYRIIDSINNFDSDFAKRLLMIEEISSSQKVKSILPDHFKQYLRKKLFEAKSIDDNLIKFILEVQKIVYNDYLNTILINFAWVKVIENINLPSFSETKSQLEKLELFITMPDSINAIIREASLRYELGFPLPTVEEIKDEKPKELIMAHTLLDTQRILNEKLNPKNAIDALKILGLCIQKNIPDLFYKIENSAKSNYRKITLKTHPDKLKDRETKARLLPVFLRAGDALETVANCIRNEECFNAYL